MGCHHRPRFFFVRLKCVLCMQVRRRRKAAEPIQEDLDWLQSYLLSLPEQFCSQNLGCSIRRHNAMTKVLVHLSCESCMQVRRRRKAAEPIQEDLDWLQSDLLSLPEQAGRDQFNEEDKIRILQCLLSEDEFGPGTRCICDTACPQETQ